MAKKYDYLWKGIVEDLFEHLLRFLYPNADEVFDLSKGITFLDTELEQLFPPEDDAYAPKVVDKLVKLYTRDGREEWVLIHLEIQGQYIQGFARRMLTYYMRILDKHDRPITAYAILTEASKKPRPNSYERSFLGTRLLYEYNTLKIAEQDDEALFASDNPFALVVLIAKTAFAGKNIADKKERDNALLAMKRRLMHEMYHRNIPKEKIRSLMIFLTYYVNFELMETSIIFEKEKKELTGGSDTMGIEQLLIETEKKKIDQKNKTEFVTKLIVAFGFSDEQAAEAATVTIDFVQKVRASLAKKKK